VKSHSVHGLIQILKRDTTAMQQHRCLTIQTV